MAETSEHYRRLPGGLFITFEGVDCSGKSTQAGLLGTYLRRHGYEVVETREPGGTAIGERLRVLVKQGSEDEQVCDEAELFMFCASRSQLMRQVIQPCLDAGAVVICDRFADSTTAYQGYGRGFDLEEIQRLHQLAIGGRWPDLTFMLDLSVEEMEQRGQMRLETLLEQDRFEDESRRFREAVRQGYLALARQFPDRIRLIAATGPVERIQQQILEHVDHALSRFA